MDDDDRTPAQRRAETVARRAEFRRRAAAGDAEAAVDLACSFVNDIPRNRRASLHWYRVAANIGGPEEMNLLGEALRDGDLGQQSHQEAVRWFRKAAELGEPNAQLNYGVCCFEGRGVKKSAAEAMRWYRKADASGESSAALNLGHMHRWGDGTPRDRAKAAWWYRRSLAKGGKWKAYEALYFLYLDAPAKLKTALRWLRKGVADNEIRCLCHLGDRHATGDGVSKSRAKAFELYLKAAELRSPWGAYKTGVCLRDGFGVPRDFVAARKWLEKARAGGVSSVPLALRTLRRRESDAARRRRKS